MKRYTTLFVFLCILYSCGSDINSITVFNQSNHMVFFAFGDEDSLDFEQLILSVDTMDSYVTYDIEHGYNWIYYASEFHQEVCAEYFGDMLDEEDIEITIDTIFEICGFCSFYTQDEGGTKVLEVENLLFCGDDYLDHANQEPVTIMEKTAWWECDEV